MIPTNNGSSASCDPISSNCVIWQGPDIACINLCNGDTVSEVIAKMAQELCDVIDKTCDCNPDLSELDLQCIAPPAQQDPDLAQYLNAIVEHVCAIPTGPDEIIVELPDCLHYTNAQGNPVTALPIDEYALYLANTICDILDAIAIINNQISELIERIIILENCVLPCTPSTGGGDPLVISSCIVPGGQPGPASTLLLALESAFCAHRDIVGLIPVVQSAINAQCIQGSFEMLSSTIGSGGTVTTYSGERDWVNTASTLAESHQNQWVVICDLYNAVQDIQQNCCDGGCDGVVIGQTSSIQTNNATGLPTQITFNFTGSTIPAGFTDCGSTINLVDSQGNQISQAFNVVAMSTSQVGVIVPLQLSGLDLTSDLNVTISTCVSDGNNQCTDSVSYTIALSLPCPSNITVTADPTNTTGTTVILAWQNQLGSQVSFAWECLDPSGSVHQSGVVAQPTGTPSVTITNLIPALTYTFEITVTNAVGNTTVCPAGSYTVPGTTCTTELLTYIDQTTPLPIDIFLGQQTLTLGTIRNWWFDVTNKEIRRVDILSGVSYSKNPQVQWSSSVSPAGDVDVDVTSRNAAPVANQITVEYSIDMINWINVTQASSGDTVTIASGATDGSIYVKAFEVDGNGDISVPTILRYDFNTNQQYTLTDVEDCPEFQTWGDALSSPVCVAGPVHHKGTMPCEGQIFNVPGSTNLNSSVWSYVGKVDDGGVVKYVHAAFKESGSCTGILLCCDCPAFILDYQLQKFLLVPAGGTLQLTVPYVLGDGTAEISLISTPLCGSITQDSNNNNVFTYTNTLSNDLCIGEALTFQISSTVQGECTSSQVTIPIQIMGNTQPFFRGDVTVFINTNGFATTDAADIELIVNKFDNQIRAACPTWDAEGYATNIIPVTDSNWLGYGKAMWDQGASASLNGSPDWVAIQNLPASWSAGSPPTSAFIVVLSNGSSPSYHDINLASGWGTFPNQQPTTQYLENYEEHIDILTGNKNSAWGVSATYPAGSPVFESGYQIALLPITMDDQNLTAANILQMFGAYSGNLINPSNYGVQTNPDLTQFMMQGIALPMPYYQSQTPAGTAVAGLRSKNVLGYFDQRGQSTIPLTLEAIKNETDQGGWLSKAVLAFRNNDPNGCPTVTGTYWKIQEYNVPGCTLPGPGINQISIKEDPALPLQVGDVIMTQNASNQIVCFEVTGAAVFGPTQGYNIQPDCVTCNNNIPPI